MDDTANLKIPYLQAAQAQKHVTHNEALRVLDAIVQLAVEDRDLATPPMSPVDGQRYIVAASATGEWAGHEGEIAAYQDNAWMFYFPLEGWLCWVGDEDKMLAFDGAAWNELVGASGSVNPVPLVGVNTVADSTNRLTVSSANTLFSHEGTDHRVKINKAASVDTASLLYQTGFGGRAELGLTGDDDFHIKVSADGSSWSEAIILDKNNGNIGMGATPETVGKLNLGGALMVRRQNNAFNSGSSVTAFILGGPGQNGGLFSVARANAAYKPFVGLSGWDGGSARTLYFGGGGWEAPDATFQQFYTAPTVSETPNAGLLRLVIRNDGHTAPGSDNAYTLGTATSRWSDIYATNGTINTSDKRQKKRINTCDLGLDFINQLKPVSYRWKVSGVEPYLGKSKGKAAPGKNLEKMRKKMGKRVHYGLLAQDVKTALDLVGCNSFAGWVLADKNDPQSEQGLRYAEFIAPLVRAVQELSEEVRRLKYAS